MIDFVLRRLDPDSDRPPFDCADSDLNEYYEQDSILGAQELISVSYAAEIDGDLAAFFSFSNDSIKKKDLSNSRRKRLFQRVPREKQYSSMPAVKIGRLGVHKDFQRTGVGSSVLSFIKYWFTHGNKTGCRFIIVDAYNSPKVTGFYERNGFDYLLTTDKSDDTRLMYFDLKTFSPE